jgi:hypothetical protein
MRSEGVWNAEQPVRKKRNHSRGSGEVCVEMGNGLAQEYVPQIPRLQKAPDNHQTKVNRSL